MTPERVPSPEATGGAGVFFEARVGGIALSRLLRGDRVAGLDTPPTRVRLQQRVADAVLDDIVLDAADPRGGTQTIEYQVKRSISITEADANFCDVIQRCMDQLDSDPDPINDDRRRFGIASRPSPALAQLDRVVRAARAHDTAEGFLQVLRSSAAREVRDRLDALRAAVAAALPEGTTDAALDTATWQVAKALYVWPVDAETDTEDVRAALDRLADLLPDAGDAPRVFGELVAAAEEWAPRAGATDVAMLRARLERRCLALNDTPSRRSAFDRLSAASERLLDPAAARLGYRLHLPRSELRRTVRAALDDQDTLVLSGRAGVGKSIAARLVARDLTDDGDAVVAVNLAGRTGPLALLEQELGTPLAEALAGAPIGGRRVLLIDGAEQALTDGGQLLAAVLNAVPVEAGSGPPWRVLLTARDEAATTLMRLVEDRTGSAPRVLVVGELDDGEVAQVVEAFPRLAPVERNARARALLLRRPYLAELLIRTVNAQDLPHDMAGEEDVLAIVNERLIHLDNGGLPGRGAPHARADIFIRLGDAVIDNALPARLDGTESEARAGLSSDDIAIEVRSSWRFAHDILADYSAATRLLEPDGPDRLAGAPSPRRLIRAARLAIQRDFADAIAARTFAAAWRTANALVHRLAGADGPRWHDLPWEAVLHLGAARAALRELLTELLAEDGAGLLRLIDVTERLARRPGVDDAGGVVPLDTTLSAPVVDLLVANAASVPERVTLAAARLVHEHLDAAAVDRGVAADLQHAAELPDAVVRWADDDRWGDRLEHAIGALALSGPVLNQRHEDFLVAHGRSRPHEVAEAVEGPRASRDLASSRPDLLLRLSGLYYLGRGLRLDGEDDTQGERPGGRGSFVFDDDEEGVRDHYLEHRDHLATWPLGNNQSNPALGPFAALLDASPAHGIRLIGAVVDAATAARSRLEAGFRSGAIDGEYTLELELTSPDWPQPLRFAGPATVWMWHRRTSVGPGPALSALMALRQWAVGRIKDGDPPRAVRDALLSAGRSVAFVSVALSALVDRIDDVVDELDPFLPHPLIWHIEIARVTHEHGTALDVPDATHLQWNLSSVAVLLVLRSDAERRQRLRELGDVLVAKHAELGGTDSELLARRWAAELDIEHFVAEPHEEGIAISVNYPAGVLEALQESGGAAVARSIRMTDLMMKAIQIRDGQRDLAEAADVWADAVAGCEQQAAEGDDYRVYSAADILSAAATALLKAAHAGHDIDDTALETAVAFLIEGAAHFGGAAPPDVVEESDEHDDRRSQVASMFWDMGADRSIADALPILLLDERLRERSRVSLDIVSDALASLASTPYDEARARVLQSLLPAWDRPCGTDEELHRTALRVARRMIATEGLARRQSRYGYAPVLMAEPLERTIATSAEISFDIAGASFGVALAAAALCDCEHGQAARALVDVLVDYDHRVWPNEYARHHYHRTDMWRHAIDSATADRVMSGDDDALDRHLDAFAPIGEELPGFLQSLVARAVDDATVARLHDVWPRVLDRLLPDVRNLEPRDDRGRGRQPSHRLVEKLDCALLLVPPDGGGWPVEETFRLGARWLAAYQGTPHVADRAIVFVGRTLGLANDLAIHLILTVLGDNIEWIRRSSQYVMAWLQGVLSNPPPGEPTARARRLLDRLAATGDDRALAIQQHLEA